MVARKRMRGQRYACIVADPPWKFGDSLPGKTRGASKQYACLDAHAIAQFSLPPLAEDCYLFLWRVAAMQGEALEVARFAGRHDKNGDTDKTMRELAHKIAESEKCVAENDRQTRRPLATDFGSLKTVSWGTWSGHK